MDSIELTPEMALQAEAIKRQRAVAEAMMNRGMQPIQSMQAQGRMAAPVSPFQGLAQIVNAYMGSKGVADADAKLKGVGEQYKTGLADAVSAYGQQKQGRPSRMDPQEIEQSSDMGSALPGPVGADPRKAVMDAMTSQYAPLRRLAQTDLQQLNRTEDRADTQRFQTEARADTQRFQAEQATAAREQRTADLQARLADQRTTAQERITAQAELARLGREQQESMARLAASLRTPPQAPQPPIIQTANGPQRVGQDNRTIPIIDASTGQPVKAPPKSAMPLSATAQKELFEADDVSNSSKNAIDILRSIITPDAKTGKSQNDLAYEGGTAELRRTAMSFVPVSSEGEDASVDLKNKVTGQALENLKAIFGGMPTEGERKILIEIQGSLNMKAAQRKEIFERAIRLAERRMAVAQDKAKRLREGTYFGAGTASNQDGGNLLDAADAILRGAGGNR